MAQDNDSNIDLHQDMSAKYMEELQKALSESDKPQPKAKKKDD